MRILLLNPLQTEFKSALIEGLDLTPEDLQDRPFRDAISSDVPVRMIRACNRVQGLGLTTCTLFDVSNRLFVHGSVNQFVASYLRAVFDIETGRVERQYLPALDEEGEPSRHFLHQIDGDYFRTHGFVYCNWRHEFAERKIDPPKDLFHGSNDFYKNEWMLSGMSQERAGEPRTYSLKNMWLFNPAFDAARESRMAVSA